MASITALDEYGQAWIVSEGDPAWKIASTAKLKLLLTQPVLPRYVLCDGWTPTLLQPLLQITTYDLEVLRDAELAGTPLPSETSESVILIYRAYGTLQKVSELLGDSVRVTEEAPLEKSSEQQVLVAPVEP